MLYHRSKSYRFSSLIEENNREMQRIRDLKGIVDGIKYRTKNGKLVEKKIPSLLDKICYIKNRQHPINLTNVELVVGLIILRNYPPISEYKGVKIMNIDEILSLTT